MMTLAWGARAGAVSFTPILSMIFSMAVPPGEHALATAGWSACGSFAFLAWSVAARPRRVSAATAPWPSSPRCAAPPLCSARAPTCSPRPPGADAKAKPLQRLDQRRGRARRPAAGGARPALRRCRDAAHVPRHRDPAAPDRPARRAAGEPARRRPARRRRRRPGDARACRRGAAHDCRPAGPRRRSRPRRCGTARRAAAHRRRRRVRRPASRRRRCPRPARALARQPPAPDARRPLPHRRGCCAARSKPCR